MSHIRTMNNRISKIRVKATRLLNKNAANPLWITYLKKWISEYLRKQSTNPSDSNLKVENDLGPDIMNDIFHFVKKP